jgi:Fe2+ transport system protein FeoA
MTLADANLGEAVTVETVGGDRGFRRRLMELGLLPGTQVSVVRVAPLGDPVELRVRGSSLSIRRAEAREVRVARAARDSRVESASPALAVAAEAR